MLLDNFLTQVAEHMPVPMGVQQFSLLVEPLRYLWEKPGKRLRAQVYFHCSHVISAQALPDITAGVLLETLHQASLLHDDVLDNSSLRRGRPTVQVLWSNKVSILLGDYLLGWVQQRLAGMDDGLAKIFSPILHDMAWGELAHLEFNQQALVTPVTWEKTLADYERIAALKTGSLFAAASEAAALFAPQAQRLNLQPLLHNFGRLLGIFYQYWDDWADYFAVPAQTGKPAMTDSANQVLTWPLLVAWHQGDVVRQAQIKEHLDSPKGASPARLLEILHEPLLQQEFRKILQQKFQCLVQNLQRLPDNEARQSLGEMIANFENEIAKHAK